MCSELIAVCIVVIVGIWAILYTLLYINVKEKEINDLTASKVLAYEYETEMANGKIISIKKQLKVNGDINVFLDIGIIVPSKLLFSAFIKSIGIVSRTTESISIVSIETVSR